MLLASNDRYQKHPLTEDFPISTLGGYRERMIAPEGPFDAQGDWTQTFGVHSVGAGASRVGSLVLSRRVRAGGEVSLRVRHEKQLMGAAGRGRPPRPRRVLEGVLQLGAPPNQLSTPRRWSFQTQVFDAGGPIAEAGLQRRAAVQEGRVMITTGDEAAETKALPGAYTVRWALFDAVGRLPRERFDPIRFTLIDHFDQFKPQQTLLFRRVLDTPIAGRRVRLYGYDQTGRGVLPWTYWVDEQGRVVVAITGLEVYMLESAVEETS